MPAHAPAPRHPLDLSNWLPRKRSLLWVLGAFVAGLVLFALAISAGRDDDTAVAPSLPAAASNPRYAPLPAPLPAERDNASGMGRAPEKTASQDDAPRLVETAPPAPPPSLPHPTAPTASSGASAQPQPLAGQTPSPRYPAAALRRGESGTVMVKAEIGIDGVPSDVTVASSSGSRLLDRAALDAVRRWRFTPALVNGQPATGSVRVPIRFDAQR